MLNVYILNIYMHVYSSFYFLIISQPWNKQKLNAKEITKQNATTYEFEDMLEETDDFHLEYFHIVGGGLVVLHDRVH